MASWEAIAFIGLGHMGYRMAANLRKRLPSSTTLLVNDIKVAACERFAQELGEFGPVKIVGTARQAADEAKTVISIVTAAPHVRSVYLDAESGVINAGSDPDRLILECSTIDLATTRQVQAQLEKAGSGLYIDTPVSGGIRGAEDGSLSFLVGHPGPPVANAVARRIFDIVSTMGNEDKIIFCGAFSTGLAAKIANNYIVCSNMAIIAEGFAMGLANGVDRKVLFDCISNSSGNSWALQNSQPVPGIVPGPASNKYKSSFPIPMMVKDMTLGVEMARLGNTSCRMGETSLGIYDAANHDPRCKDLDCTSVWLHVSDCAFDPEFDLQNGYH